MTFFKIAQIVAQYLSNFWETLRHPDFFKITQFGHPMALQATALKSFIVSSQNCTYIRNPGFPSAYAGGGSVSYTINKCSSGKWFWAILKKVLNGFGSMARVIIVTLS